MKNFKILYITLFTLATLVACDYEKASVDSAEPGSIDNKPTVTITSDVAQGAVDEGTVINFTLQFDKQIPYSVGFHAVISGSAGEADVDLGSGRVNAFANSAVLSVEIIDDLVPELDESLTIKIEPDSPASAYYVHPNSNLSGFSYTIKSPVDPDDLIVALDWDFDSAHDLDMFSISADYGAWDVQWTSDHPEVKNLIWGSDPDGTYYLSIDPYSVEPGVTEFWYKWSLGQPNGTVTVIDGIFDYANRDTAHTVDTSFGFPTYVLVKVVKTGTTFVATPM